MAKTLLLLDAVINLVLGILLVFYPDRLVVALGLPVLESAFYASVLGGVLFGIGIALLVAFRGGAHGLGLDGAIAINLCGAGVLAAWLLLTPEAFSPRGRVTLWVIAVIVIGLGLIEMAQRKPS